MVKGLDLFILLLIVATTSLAGEKTLDVAPKITYPAAQKSNTVVLPIVREKYKYYEVCGSCENDLQCELKAKCIRWIDGKKYDSVTDWQLKWDYGYNRTPEACTPESFTVTVDIVYQLPKWTRTGNPSGQLEEKWARFMEKLMLHEKGHRDIAVAAANELTGAIAELPPARTCEDLDRAISTLCRSRITRMKKEQKAYDATTSHGVTQGAVFP